MKFNDDAEALKFLEEVHSNFVVKYGLIINVTGKLPSADEWEAIAYLINEWDYEYGKGGDV